MNYLKKGMLSLAVISALGFSGCGNTNPTNDDVSKGVFIDSSVSGIAYKTVTKAGLTDDNGTFKYKEGEEVTFSIGGIKLGATRGEAILTPQELAGVTEVNNSRAEDILVLLQTLDKDHNASNGIDITETIRGTAESMNINFLEDSINMDAIINQFGIDASYKVSNSEAIAHFQETLKLKYPDIGLKFTSDMILNKSFYKIFVKEDKTTVIYVKVTFNENNVRFIFGTKDDYLNGTTGTDTGSYSINQNGTLKNGNDIWKLLKIEEDKIVILNTINTDDNGNTIAERQGIEKWLSKKPVGFP